MAQTSTTQSRNFAYLPFIQCVCSVAVVFMHTNGGFWTYSDTVYWKVSNLIESLFYFAVPVFFMISGATLMDFSDKYTLREFFARRAKKTLLPFLFWSLVAVVYLLLSGGIKLGDLHPLSLFAGIVGSKYVSIFWFFPSIFGLYMCMPLFSAVEKEKRVQVFTYLLVAGFIVNSLIPILGAIKGYDYECPISVSVVTENLWFALCGYMFVACPPRKGQRILLYLLSILGFLGICVGTYLSSANAGTVVWTFKGYYTPLSYIYSMGVFVFLQQIGERVAQMKISALFRKFSKYTMAIYLLHYFVMKVVQGVLGLNPNTIFYSLAAPLWVIPISVLITMVIRKIPVLSRVLPE